jgi:two-component system phosphate regulon sensor histidine kinase PhoR
MALAGVWALAGKDALDLAFLLFAGAAGAAYAARQVRFPKVPQPDPGPDPRTQQALERAEAQVSVLLDAGPDPLLVISGREPDDLSTLRIERANAAARSLFRISGPPALLVSALRDPEVLSAVDEALFGGVEARCAYTSGAAQERSFQVRARPLAAQDDALSRAVLVFRDETDLRRAERTRADFLANASHELRTPLASLSGFIETLSGHAREDREAQDRFLGIMRNQAERMGRLIDDLLSLSRIELNEHVAPRGQTDLALAAADVVDALGPQAKLRGVGLEATLPAAGEAVICGDRDQIVQVIQNLTDNALKYAPPGSAAKVEVRPNVSREASQAPVLEDAARLTLVSPDALPPTFMMIQVRDEGPGMEREHLPRLAERFYRVEGQKSGERPGTGLGLSIVKHIVNRHHGVLSVESAPGRGTVFTVLLPASLTVTELSQT